MVGTDAELEVEEPLSYPGWPGPQLPAGRAMQFHGQQPATTNLPLPPATPVPWLADSLFFRTLWWIADSQAGTNTVDLTHTDGEGKTLSQLRLDLVAWDMRGLSAGLLQPLAHLPSQFGGVSMSAILRSFLEYVIMPPFLIVWYVGLDIAARRPVVFHLLRSKRFSRACFWPGARL